MKVKFVLTKEENERLIEEKIREHFPNSRIELSSRPSYGSDAYSIEVDFELFKFEEKEENFDPTQDIEERRIGG